MALCITVDANGRLVQADSNIDDCTGYIALDYVQYNLLIEPILTPSEISTAFVWGFGAVVVLGYFSSYPIGLAKRLIKMM